MIIINRDFLFVKFCDIVNNLEHDMLRNLLGLQRWKKQESTLTIPELLTLLLCYKFSHINNIKAFIENERDKKSTYWKSLPSYERIIVWFNRLDSLLEFILNNHLHHFYQELGFIDSTKIETSNVYWFGKVHKQSSKGHSSTGPFRGFKLHVLINEQWLISKFQVTSASTHDLDPIKQGLLKGCNGKILGDSGYVSKDLYFQLMQQNLTLIAKPKAISMEDNKNGLGLFPFWDKNFKPLYKKRVNIERYFDYLKNKIGLVSNKSHSTKGLMVQIFSTLLAAQWYFSKSIDFIKK